MYRFWWGPIAAHDVVLMKIEEQICVIERRRQEEDRKRKEEARKRKEKGKKKERKKKKKERKRKEEGSRVSHSRIGREEERRKGMERVYMWSGATF